MKHLNKKTINLLIMMMLFFSFKGISQNTNESTNNMMGTINTSGSDAIGSTGTVTYSIGQVFYTYIGESVYNVAQGIQHNELIEAGEKTDNSLSTEDHLAEPTAEIFIFPNPTTDYVNISMKGFESGSGQQSYQLYDLKGRLLKQDAIDQTETQINLSNLSSSIYILQVSSNNKNLKSFKIIKK